MNILFYQNYISEGRGSIPEVISDAKIAVADIDLWQEFQAGSEVAYATIYRNNVSLLYGYGLKLIKDKELIKDCIQDLFVEIWNNKHKLGRVQSIKSYLFKCIRRKLIAETVKRRKKSSTLASSPILIKSYAIASIEYEIVEKQHGDQHRAKLKKALGTLTDRQKEIIHLRYYAQLSYEEIAEIMALSTKGAYKLMGRAINFLRKCMVGLVLLILIL